MSNDNVDTQLQNSDRWLNESFAIGESDMQFHPSPGFTTYIFQGDDRVMSDETDRDLVLPSLDGFVSVEFYSIMTNEDDNYLQPVLPEFETDLVSTIRKCSPC